MDRSQTNLAPIIPNPEAGLSRGGHGWAWRFAAMASPCEVIIDGDDARLAELLGRIAQAEAERVECKFSRYRPDSVVSRLNASRGTEIEVDAETAQLIDYAAACHALSDGLFDLTSGVLRRVWRFDGSDRIPAAEDVTALLPLVGWERVSWRSPQLILPAGMEIDFGGLGKEYAVDRAVLAVAAAADSTPFLVNFGGDLRASGPRRGGDRWRVGLEAVDAPIEAGVIEIAGGALATSGDARRFLLKDGRRYSHILNPRTGWPVENPPRSVTVAAPTCLEAGLLSTLTMLQGEGAEAFLEREGLTAWWSR